jgi:succinate dehydrogenase / fumarate reductase flavoprotein subunit
VILDGKCPTGPIQQSWDKHRFDLKLVNPANKRKYNIIVVGTGLAGGAAAASLGELGYNVQAFCYQDSPRRAHSIAAQGGINAAKAYPNDGDSIYRLFYDTIKGGDFRAREADVWRLAQVSNNIIDQCVAQGVPFARDYAGYLDNRSFGGSGFPYVLCPWSNRPAAVAGRLLRSVPPDQAWHGKDVCPS